MKRAFAEASSTIDPENAKEPHIYTELLGFLSGEYILTPSERRRVNVHLGECIECQTLMGKYLVDAVTYLKEHGQAATQVQVALQKLSKLTHKTLKRDIPAYAEIAESQDKDKVRERFPFLAAHIEICEECRLAIQDIREWLREESKIGSSESFETS